MSKGDGIVFPYRWEPRIYQIPAWNAISMGCRRLALFWHRRAGKDLWGINRMATSMQKRHGLYWHAFPQLKMGKRIAWNGMTNDGRKFRSAFPDWDRAGERGAFLKSSNNNEMYLETKEGDVYQIIGTEDPDALRGPNPVFIDWSEFAYMDGDTCRGITDPILAANEGIEVINTTPNGKNHAWRLYQLALKDQFDHKTNPNGWFVQRLTIDDTKTLLIGTGCRSSRGISGMVSIYV